jgi:DNA-binding transcriptional MerR regulator
MRTQLHIGEVAQLLGVTPKTIRHYQRIELINEPERTEAGYRLYTAHDLLRLQRIRRLQSFGLSLKQIKEVLGGQERQHNLREVLLALDHELALQIRDLQERRQKIAILLEEGADLVLDPLQLSSSPTFETVKQVLGERLKEISPAALAQEAKMDAVFDSFHWPPAYTESMRDMAHFFASQPELYTQLIAFVEQLTALASLPEDAPEVDRLLEEFAHNDKEFRMLFKELSTVQSRLPQLTEPFANALGGIMSTTLSPAQQRFLKEIACFFPSEENEGT